MQKRLATARIWLSQNRGKYCKLTVKTKGCGSWGVAIYNMYIYTYLFIYLYADLHHSPRRNYIGSFRQL